MRNFFNPYLPGYTTFLLSVYKASLFWGRGGSEKADYKTSLFRGSQVAVYKNLQKVFPDLFDYKTSLNFRSLSDERVYIKLYNHQGEV